MRWIFESNKKTSIQENLNTGFYAGSRGRTGTPITGHGILSPERLPIPPYRQHQIIIQNNMACVNGEIDGVNSAVGPRGRG